MKRGAKAHWIQWQRYRYQGLCAEGLEASIAYRIAAVEAKTRRKLAQIIGREHARKAELEWHVSGDSVRFSLIGTIEGLTDEQVAALEEMNAITVK